MKDFLIAMGITAAALLLMWATMPTARRPRRRWWWLWSVWHRLRHPLLLAVHVPMGDQAPPVGPIFSVDSTGAGLIDRLSFLAWGRIRVQVWRERERDATAQTAEG